MNEVTYEAATWGSGWKEAEQGSTVVIASFDNQDHPHSGWFALRVITHGRPARA